MPLTSSMDDKLAILDRQVRVVVASNQPPIQMRVSELREYDHVVLLGGPGIGKSTVLRQEAAAAGDSVYKVWDLVSGLVVPDSSSLFLDALDEYRMEGVRSDKTVQLSRALREVTARRWRLTCRSEDWHGGADLNFIRHSTAGRPIVVAHLLPLTGDEAIEILDALGASDPKGFLRQAQLLGAGPFVQSPLSLKLVHAAVARGGRWPKSRHALFEAAILQLADEYNEMHREGPRAAPERIVEAAEQTCVAMLLTGKRGIGRSVAPSLPSTRDGGGLLRSSDLQLPAAVFDDMLDSSLFKGESGVFEPIHRTVAEYLAGRALARAVAGDDDRAALPLGRALTLLTGFDRKAPTELRGLYAWFAIHLGALGELAAAERLIECDATTVLVYGDAGALPTPLRRSILYNLDRDDPYFRHFDNRRDTFVGSLSGADLEADFDRILAAGADGTHRLITVFDALTGGAPLEGLGPRLWAVATDPTRPGWERQRACDAWLNGREDRLRELYDAVTASAASADRESIRVHLAVQLPPDRLTAFELRRLIADVARSRHSSASLDLYPLVECFERQPILDFFDVHVSTWLPPEIRLCDSVDLEIFFETLLSAWIDAKPNLSARELWSAVNNVRSAKCVDPPETVAAAVRRWLEADRNRASALLDVIVEDEDSHGAPWVAVSNFWTFAQRPIAPDLFRYVVATANDLTDASVRRARFEVALHSLAHLSEHREALSAEFSVVLRERPDCADLLEKLNVKRENVSESIRAAQSDRLRAQAEETRAKNIEALTPHLEEIRTGRRIGWLAKAASLYLDTSPSTTGMPCGLPRIASLTDDRIASATEAGWLTLFSHGTADLDARALGALEGSGTITHFERCALAGLDVHLRCKGAFLELSIPLTVAIAVIRGAWMLHASDRRKEFEQWAIARLNAEPVSGAQCLTDFWSAAIEAGPIQIDSYECVRRSDAPGPAVADALTAVLKTKRAMPPALLSATLRLALHCVEPRRLLDLATAALGDRAMTGERRELWQFLAFSLEPRGHGASLLSEHRRDGGARIVDEIRRLDVEGIGPLDGSARAHRDETVILIVGPMQRPETDAELLSGTRRGNADLVRHAIQRLACSPHPGAGDALARLLTVDTLSAWKTDLQHARAQWARLHREDTFRFPEASAVLAALSGGPPVNAPDLQVVVMEALEILGREFRRSDNTPWKRFWNTGTAHFKPKTENECRDYLLERLRDRLRKYKIAALLPEIRRADDTRADLIAMSLTGSCLPIEIKRHYNCELWRAPTAQLARYAHSEGSEGYGIYLILWFGREAGACPPMPSGTQRPCTADELQAALNDALSARGPKILPLVLDVSRPSGSPTQ